jgi:hypothetical protein
MKAVRFSGDDHLLGSRCEEMAGVDGKGWRDGGRNGERV